MSCLQIFWLSILVCAMLRRSVFVWMLQFMQMIMPKTYLWRTIYQLGKFKLKLLVWNMRLLLSKVRNLAALNRCFHQEAAVQEVRRFDTKLPIEVSTIHLTGVGVRGAFTNYEEQILPSFDLPSPLSEKNWNFTQVLFVTWPARTFYWPPTPSSCPRSNRMLRNHRNISNSIFLKIN